MSEVEVTSPTSSAPIPESRAVAVSPTPEPDNVTTSPKRRLIIPVVSAFVVLAAVAGGWALWSNRPPSKADIPNAVALLGMDEKGVEQALTRVGATRVPGTQTGGQMSIQALLMVKAASQVSYDLPRLDTWSKRTAAVAAMEAHHNLDSLVLRKSLAPVTTDAQIQVLFDSSGKCIGATLELSGLAARTVLGSEARLVDVARAAGLPSDAVSVDSPSDAALASEFSGLYFDARFTVSGKSHALKGTWVPVADASMKPMSDSVDAGNVTLDFGPSSLVNGSATTTPDASASGSPSGWTRGESGTKVGLSAVTFVNPNNGWVVGSNNVNAGTDGIVLATTDGGVHWATQFSSATMSLVSVAFSDTSHGWTVGADANSMGIILATTDGGATWTPQYKSTTTADDFTSVAFANVNDGWVVGTNGTILHTIDGGIHWEKQISGTENVLNSVCFVDAMHGWAVGNSNPVDANKAGQVTILHTSDGGLHWTLQTSSAVGIIFNSVDFIDATHGWAVGSEDQSDGGYSTIIATSDGGAHWVTQDASVTNKYGLGPIFFVNATHGWALGFDPASDPTNGEVILSTTDGGVTWAAQTLDLSLSSLFFTDETHGWGVGDNGLIVSTANGGVDSSASSASNSANGTPYTPAKGSAERTALMNAAHTATGNKHLYLVDDLYAEGDWAVGWLTFNGSGYKGDTVCAWHEVNGTWKCVVVRYFWTGSSTPLDAIYQAFSDAGVPAALVAQMPHF
jgi:photosystem II stability/assembly factor-like uncharacterized protein